MSPEHRTSVEQSAIKLLLDTKALLVPVDPTAVARALNISVHLETLEDNVSGVLYVKDDSKHILVNKQHHPYRQRFTVAHELGHFVLHDAPGRLFIDTKHRIYQRVGTAYSQTYAQPGSTTTPEEERDANYFAAALLMPEPLVRQAAPERDFFDESDVATLSGRFQVSEQAMAIRLQEISFMKSVWLPETT